MSEITTVGIDLAKNVLSVHGVDTHGKTVLRKSLSRAKLLELMAQLRRQSGGRHGCSNDEVAGVACEFLRLEGKH